jgi:hypothetical protein
MVTRVSAAMRVSRMCMMYRGIGRVPVHQMKREVHGSPKALRICADGILRPALASRMVG